MGDTHEHENGPDNYSQRQGQPHKGPLFITLEALSVSALLILGYMFATDSAHRNTAIWIFFAAYVLVGFFAALYLTRSHPNELDKVKQTTLSNPPPMKEERPNINITSHGQSGGFTGINEGTVNLGPEPRVISDDKYKRFIEAAKSVPKGDVTVRFVADNVESHNFSLQIRSLLSDAGYNVAAGVWAVAMFGTPVKGVVLEPRHKDNPPEFAKALQHLLGEIGIDAPGSAGSTSQGENELIVYVGLKP